MNKNLMLLGLCMVSAFGALQADDSVAVANQTAIPETTVAAPAEVAIVVVDEKEKEDCGCRH